MANKVVPALCGATERQNSGCCEAPKKLGLSFSIEEILKRPTEKSDRVRQEAGRGPGSGKAEVADSRREKPRQDQPHSKCLLVISYTFLGLRDPAGLRQRKGYSILTEERALGWDLNPFLSSPEQWLFRRETKAQSFAECRHGDLIL